MTNDEEILRDQFAVALAPAILNMFTVALIEAAKIGAEKPDIEKMRNEIPKDVWEMANDIVAARPK